MPHFPWHSPSAIAHTHCVCGFSLNLNKSTSYPTLCLSLNYFCNEASRTWSSLGPETRYCGFWLGSIPKLGLGWFESKHMSSSPSWVRLLSHDWLFAPMDCSIPGFPVHHQLLEFTKTHVHWIDDAIQPPHPLSSLAPPAFNLSQHQNLFRWVSYSHQVTKVLRFKL